MTVTVGNVVAALLVIFQQYIYIRNKCKSNHIERCGYSVYRAHLHAHVGLELSCRHKRLYIEYHGGSININSVPILCHRLKLAVLAHSYHTVYVGPLY